MKRTILLFFLCLLYLPAHANGWHPEVFLTGLSWHSPQTYSAQQRAHFSDTNPGGGVGLDHSSKHSTQLLYVIDFTDSDKDSEPLAGYAYFWHILGPCSAGASLGLTSRDDINNDELTPFALPALQVRLGHFRLYGTYLPFGHYSEELRGDVAFFFAGWVF